MAFISSNFSAMAQTLAGGHLRIFAYYSTDDISTILGSEYFTNAADQGAKVGDLVVVIGTSAGDSLCSVSEISASGNVTVVASGGELGVTQPPGDNSTNFATTAFVQTELNRLNVKEFGALGDGSTDDTVALTAAVAAGMAQRRIVYFPKGIYPVTSSLTANVSNSYVKIRGEGEDSVIFSNVEDAAVFRNTASLTASSTLSSPTVVGDRNITVASTSGYVADMDIEIRDTSQFVVDWDTGLPGGIYIGEMNRIKRVTDGTHLLLWSSVEDNYTAGTQINILAASTDWDIRDIAFDHTPNAATSANQRGIALNHVRRVTLDNIVFRNFDSACIRLSYVLDGVITNVRGEGLNSSDPVENLNPYLVSIAEGCSGVLCERLHLRQGRHCFTTLTSAANIESAHITVSDSSAYECMASGFDTHPGSRHILIDNCQVWGSDLSEHAGSANGLGFQLRGRKNIIQNCKASGVFRGAQLSNAEECSILNSDFTACDIGVSILNSPKALVKGVTIRDPINYGVKMEYENTPTIEGVIVSDVRVFGDPAVSAVDFSDYWDNSFIVEKIHAPDATVKFVNVPDQHYYIGRPDTVKFESVPRSLCDSAAVDPLTSGTMYLTAVQMEAGEYISQVGFVAATEAIDQTNLWVALYNQDREILAITADSLTSIPVAGAHTKLTFDTPIITPYRGVYYVGILQVAATTSTFYGHATNSALIDLVPIQAGDGTPSLETPTDLFTPLHLGSKLKAWWSADDHGTGDMTDDGAGLISSWKDRIGGMDLTATLGARPTWAATSFNSAFPGVTFDGVANCLASTSLGTIPTGATGGEIFSVLSQDSTIGTLFGVMYGGVSGATARALVSVFSAALKFRLSDGATPITDTIVVFSGPKIVSGAWSGTTETGRIDGRNTTPSSATIATLNTDTTRFRMGSNNANTAAFFWNGKFRHLIVTTILTAEQRINLEGWAAWDSNLTSVLPSSHPYKLVAPSAVDPASEITASDLLPYISVG